MTLKEFIDKYNGKGIDADGAYGNQCMDLMHQYIVEVLGLDLSLFAAPTAYQAYQNANDSRFTKIDNTPTGVPQAGDIMFWNTTVGSAGHVAVFISGDTNSFTSFDQNWPTGSLCHEQKHDYKGVAGWLHFNDQQSIIDELRKARDDNWQLHLQDQQTISDKQKEIENLSQQLQNLREAFDKQTQADADTGSQLLDAQHERDSIKSDFESLCEALGCPPTLKDALTQVDSLKTASDDISKHAEKTIPALAEAAIYQRTPKTTSKLNQLLEMVIAIGKEVKSWIQ